MKVTTLPMKSAESTTLSYEDALKRFQEVYLRKPYLKGNRSDAEIEETCIRAAKEWSCK